MLCMSDLGSYKGLGCAAALWIGSAGGFRGDGTALLLSTRTTVFQGCYATSGSAYGYRTYT
jgi:hypothetical protein